MQNENTISGLLAKRSELEAGLSALQIQVAETMASIAHIDAAIGMFDPEAVPKPIHKTKAKYRSKKGSLQRFVMECFRTAHGPITARQVADAWIDAQGLQGGSDTVATITHRISACLHHMKRQGNISFGHDGWSVI